VVEGIKAGTVRPTIPSCPSAMQSLMERCWDQSPSERPAFPEILDAIEEWIQKNPPRNFREHLAHQSTALVNKMLPEHVARALQEGRRVEPEQFSSCTILFSDIVGYTTISSAFAPKEVMSMLDRVYVVCPFYSLCLSLSFSFSLRSEKTRRLSRDATK